MTTKQIPFTEQEWKIPGYVIFFIRYASSGATHDIHQKPFVLCHLVHQHGKWCNSLSDVSLNTDAPAVELI
jgi:hypothetical protein